ncbi:hypothetical protein JST97_11645 [bacterium]|nr:hypothetical protein [bacterium]
MRQFLLLGLMTSSLWAQAPERKLVFLRSQGFSSWAESSPAFDYSCYLPRRYSLRGLEENLIKAVASSGGLPTRLLGVYQGDLVQVAPQSLRLEPPLLPLSLNVRNPWRGVVAVRGRKEMACVPGQWQPCLGATGEDGLYQVTAWSEGGQVHLQDLTPLGPVPTATVLQGPLRAVISEGFLDRSLQLYRQAHPQLFRVSDPVVCEIGSLGLTTIPGHLRAYGSVNGQITGLGKLVEGEWEAPIQLDLKAGYARLKLSAQGQSMRLTKPVFAEMPQAWADQLSGLAQRIFSSSVTLPVPGAYLQPLLESGLVTPPELEQLRILPAGWGDRRSGCLMLTSGSGTGPPEQMALAAPDGFALGLGADALNRGIAQSIRLPVRVNLPAEGIPSPRVLIFKVSLKQVEIQQLSLRYQAGAFRFDPCVVAVAWEMGPLSGLEPGARVVGTALPVLENGRLLLRMNIEQLEFLSPQLMQQSPPEQQRIRQQILDGLQKTPLPLALPTRLSTEVHPQAQLQITAVDARADALWLAGRWSD